MRRALVLLWILAFGAFAAATPAGATPVTVQITGTWYNVADTASVLDGSISVGGSFTLTLVYDDAAIDQDGSAGFGAYFTAAASSDLSVVAGNYTFAPGSSVGVGVENDNLFGEDLTFLNATGYTATGPLPGGVGTGATAFLDANLTDTSGSAHGSDALLGLNWSLPAFDASDVYLFIQITGQGPGQFIEFAGTIDEISVLPEPSSVALLCLAGVALLGARSRA